MKTTWIVSLAVALAVPAATAQAAEWQMFMVGPEFSSYFDASSVHPVGDHLRVSTYIQDLKGDRMSAATQYEVDCKGGRARAVHRTTYSGPDLEGNVLVDDQSKGHWLEAKKGTFAEALLARVCPKTE